MIRAELRSAPLFAVLATVACGGDDAESLPDGGFTTGDTSATESAPMTMTMPITSTPTSAGTATTEPTGNTDPTGDPSPTGDPGSTSDPTDDSTGDPTTDPTEVPEGCGNDQTDPDQVCVFAGTPASVGANPSSVAVGDFNGDGNADAIVTNTDDDNVSVLLGDGVGGLGEATSVDVGAGPTRVRAVELSGDANVDAIVANSGADTVSVLIADGSGGFALTDLTVGDEPVDLAVDDITGDESADFAVACAGTNQYVVGVNDGAGAMALEPAVGRADIPQLRAVAFSDFAFAEGPDILLGGANEDDGVFRPFRGAGDGTFNAAPPISAAGTLLSRFNVGSADGDPELDVAAVDNGTAALVILGDDNDASAALTSSSYGPYGGVSEALLVDVTGEGDADLVIAAQDDNVVAVHPGNGMGMFGDAQEFAVEGGPSGIAAGDFNGDDVNDLAVSCADDDTITLLLSNP